MKNVIFGTFLSTSILLSACSLGASTNEQLTDTLAKVYEEEQGYRDAQEQLAQLEKKEQTTFNSVMELTQDKLDEVSTMVDFLNESLDKRLTSIDSEHESILAAQESLSSLDKLVEETKDEAAKKTLTNLKDSLVARYEAHQVVYDEYIELTTLQTELYDMLPNEETEQVQLQEQVQKINKQNDIVQSSINAFNETTKKVNDTKNDVFETLNKK